MSKSSPQRMIKTTTRIASRRCYYTRNVDNHDTLSEFIGWIIIGLTVSDLYSEINTGYRHTDYHAGDKKHHAKSDIGYGNNNEFGFDLSLRDHIWPS